MKRARSIALGAALGLVTLVGASSTARAQDSTRDPAAAESLFQTGVDLLKKDDWSAACKAFEGSMKLDPSVGAQINLARCAAHDGLLARAWADFRRAKALNAETPLAKRKANVDSYVDGEIAKLEPRLPWVTIRLRVKHEHLVPAASVIGLKIERDGVVVPVESLDIAVAIDPGKRAFSASAPGYVTATSQVEFREGEKKEVALELVPEPQKALPAPGPTQPPAPAPPSLRREEPDRPLLWAGITIGAVGAGGLIVAGVTGGLALADHGSLEDLVKTGACSQPADVITCNPEQRAEVDDAIARGETLALVSTVTLFAGAGLFATGVVLTVVGATTPSASDQPELGFVPWAGPGVAGLTLRGSLD